MKESIVFLNEQHKLMEEQEKILNSRFGENWEIFPIPKDGWSLQDMNDLIIHKLDFKVINNVIFASPIPYLIKQFTLLAVVASGFNMLIFHNDKREKKELPNGKIIFTPSQTGWQLV